MTLYNIVHNKIRYREAAHSVKKSIKINVCSTKAIGAKRESEATYLNKRWKNPVWQSQIS